MAPDHMTARWGLSENAVKLARLLAERSVVGRPRDPRLTPSEVAEALGIAGRDAAVVAAELERGRMAVVSHALAEGTNSFRTVCPTPLLFWRMDPIVRRTDPVRDAKMLARSAVQLGKPVVAASVLAAALSWDARRLNPAALFLVDRCHAKGSNELSPEWAFPYLVVDAGTHAFAQEPDDPTPPTTTDSSEMFDVALSFAGEDRQHAEALARALNARGVGVFYDDDRTADLWGKDLYEYLADVYENKARFCVIFVSGHYAAKRWTTHERRSAQARAFRERREYILPIRIDTTQLPGVPETIGYLTWAAETPESVADKIRAKLAQLCGPEIPAATARSGSDLELTVGFKTLDTHGGDRHDCRLDVVLTNRGVRTIDVSHVDIAFPLELIDQQREHPPLVLGRSNDRMGVFRYRPSDAERTLYPGDHLPITLGYFIDRDLYWRHMNPNAYDPLQEVVHVAAYADNQRLEVERPMSELHVF